MTALLSALWPGLAGALLLGLAIGGVMGLPDRRVVPLGLLGAALLLAGLAQSGILSGLIGFSVEAAALILPVYLVGCLSSALLLKSLGKYPSRSAGADR
ncbi:hypothetical protein [Methylobacterium planeticum]|uniref:Uncharacterized protein n=1 Tax=Methylobacterium planeticum TaxID=2615211 RepID=A0A6N6MUJ6_9HYPH|nr:hypothetical protein [Methylobacterium planeticum]KAB1075164.1 hypothetical protein F6X51_04555 [Methylobacterium planeticum]